MTVLRKRIGSDEARRWARSLRLGNPYAKAILMAVANYVDENGCAFPGIDTLHQDTEIAHNTIVSRLKWCDEIGAIIFSKCWVDEHGVRNRNGRGRITSSEIQFLMEADIEAVARAAATSAAPRTNRGWAAKKTGDDDQSGSAPHAEQNESVSPSLAPQQPCTPCGRIAEQKESPPQTPPQKGGALKEDLEFEKDWSDFRAAAYPDGIIDLGMARAELRKIPHQRRREAIDGVAPYTEYLRRRKQKSKAAHLYIRKGLWEGLSAAPAVTQISGYAPDSREGRALMTLARIARYTLPRMGSGNIIFPREITAQMLAFAEAPHDWAPQQRGTGNYASYRDLLTKIFPRMAALPEVIFAPWPFPPRVDGSIGPPAQSTDPPRPVMTEEDEEYLRENQGL